MFSMVQISLKYKFIIWNGEEKRDLNLEIIDIDVYLNTFTQHLKKKHKKIFTWTLKHFPTHICELIVKLDFI